MAERLQYRQFLSDVAQVADGDYATGFKMLGFVLFVAENGDEDLLSGSMVSLRTYYRWLETIKAAGWQSLLAELRLSQAIREYVNGIDAQPTEIRSSIIHRLDEVLTIENV